jgi:YD repeat-containing protein
VDHPGNGGAAPGLVGAHRREISPPATATTPNWALVAAATSYDEFGNRLSQAKVPGSPPEITLSYGESTNRITTSGYTYDLNGDITAMPGITGIQWDVFDRMTQATANGSTTNYKYDAFGRRAAQQAPNGTNFYFYDMAGGLLLRLETEPRLKSAVADEPEFGRARMRARGSGSPWGRQDAGAP